MTKTGQRLIKSAKQAAGMSNKLDTNCPRCHGDGWYHDMFYSVTGSATACDSCYGTGLPAHKVQQLLDQAFKPFRKAIP